jgi:aminoglycoside phosphotransferase (APT) family kinase protein
VTSLLATPDRIEDQALWDSVAVTLRDVIVPALPPGHERDTAVQLGGLAEYARTRPTDQTPVRLAQLSEVLGAEPVELPAALQQAGALLADAVASPQDWANRAGAAEVRRLMLEFLREDIAAAQPLMMTFAGHPATDVRPADRIVPADERHALTSWLTSAFAEEVAIVRAVVMSGGHSRRMVRVSVRVKDQTRELVIRIEQGGMFGTDGTTEALAMRDLAAAGIPVPEVPWIEPSTEPLGHPFFVMNFVTGASEPDEESLEQFLHVLRAVHEVEPARLSDALGPVPPSPEQAIQDAVQGWTNLYRASVRTPVPLLEEAAEWLRHNLHPTGPPVVVHGDPGPGNFLHAGGRITALTDWEFVHYGDPAEDWAYFATIRARKLDSADGWFERIAKTVDIRNDPATWRAWEAFNQFKGACANLTALRLFRDTEQKAPNQLAIGTAVHLRFVDNLAKLVA